MQPELRVWKSSDKPTGGRISARDVPVRVTAPAAGTISPASAAAGSSFPAPVGPAADAVERPGLEGRGGRGRGLVQKSAGRAGCQQESVLRHVQGRLRQLGLAAGDHPEEERDAEQAVSTPTLTSACDGMSRTALSAASSSAAPARPDGMRVRAGS